MKLRALFILFSLLSHLTSTAAAYWKHNEQQGDVGACHTFATVALVEAEYWNSKGKHINLSERDLFIRHYTQSYTSPADCVRSQLTSSTIKKIPDHFKEAGHISHDFALLQRHGIASERELRYKPNFSAGVDISLALLRHQRNELAIEADLLKKANRWNATVQQKLIQQRYKKLTRVTKALTLPADTKTHHSTKKFISHYSLVKLTPKTTQLAKRQILQQLPYHPVAVDITNLSELAGNMNTLHSKHSLVVSHYHSKTDQFTIRSSTFKGNKKVSANALARGTYAIYYLKKK